MGYLGRYILKYSLFSFLLLRKLNLSVADIKNLFESDDKTSI